MNIKALNIILKFFVYSYIILVGMALFYAITHAQAANSIILAFNFILGLVVGSFLIKYYSNAIESFKINSEYITLINAKKVQSKIKKDECVKILFKPNKVIMEFSDERKFYFFKSNLFKNNFDFSEFNNDNFKNANITNIY